jgi:UDP-N-acetylmuramoyl-tripeptide--D-alanyl-D-alanine ligase
MWRERAGSRRVIGFGESRGAEVRAELSGAGHASGGQRLEMDTPLGRATLMLAVPGAHNARNALAAAAAAIAAGAGLDAVVSGLEGFRAVRGRMQVRAGRGGALLIDDTYNANPDSVRAAIDALSAHAGRRVLVLGDMGEVGEQGPAFHEEVGRHARERGIERLLCTGELSRHAAGAFGAPEHFADVAGIVDALTDELRAGTAILVKGSRFMRMERVAAALEAPDGEHA